MKNNIIAVMSPKDMPEAVKKAITTIWAKNKRIPSNIADICYTYGPFCYSPRELSRDLIVHESVHTEQQERIGGAELWWDKYGQDEAFRYSQELEAYRAQYKYIKATMGDRKAFKHADLFASEMSAEMYGGMCNKAQALKDILHN